MASLEKQSSHTVRGRHICSLRRSFVSQLSHVGDLLKLSVELIIFEETRTYSHCSRVIFYCYYQCRAILTQVEKKNIDISRDKLIEAANE